MRDWLQILGISVCVSCVLYFVVYGLINEDHAKDETCIKVSEDYLMYVYQKGYYNGANSVYLTKNVQLINPNINTYFRFDSLKAIDTTEFRKQIKQLVKH